jgi:hypothetical protein
MTRDHFHLWRVLLIMKALITRIDRGSFRFNWNFTIYDILVYFISLSSHIFQTRPLVCKKPPALPCLSLRYSWNLRLSFIFLVEHIFVLLPAALPLQGGLTHPSMHDLPQMAVSPRTGFLLGSLRKLLWITYSLKMTALNQIWWYMPIIPASVEVEIGRIVVWDQPRQKVMDSSFWPTSWV